MSRSRRGGAGGVSGHVARVPSTTALYRVYARPVPACAYYVVGGNLGKQTRRTVMYTSYTRTYIHARTYTYILPTSVRICECSVCVYVYIYTGNDDGTRLNGCYRRESGRERQARVPFSPGRSWKTQRPNTHAHANKYPYVCVCEYYVHCINVDVCVPTYYTYKGTRS